uniref:O-succinylbenzoate--CoA ligase n=2 Tax=Vibrio ziniensis TaxID=2711221 RepID=A0A6G7CJH5_9VIBR|nr:o-succinylbenzoate--CoA ligase [Vibrio ziniensis]QIH42252.1 o-succinylbenzoate--CoA ligase [Vibrio ziniensis]
MTPWHRHQQCHPDRVALCFSNTQGEEVALTWQQLCCHVEQYQAALLSHGINTGDVLTLVGRNHIQMLMWFLAAQQSGIVCAFAMPQSASQLAAKLNTLYTSSQTVYLWLADSAQCLAEEFNGMERNIEFIEFIPPHNETLSSLVQTQYRHNNLASIIFTSGSTGNPKAVVHNHEQHFASAQGLIDVFRYQSGDTWLLSLPMYHVSGLAIIYRWLHSGACLKIGNGELAKDIQNVTHASLVPTQLKRLLDSKQELTLSHVLLGGSHIPHDLGLQAAKLGIETWLGYGMTEAASTVTAKRVNETSTTGKVLARRRVKLEGERIYIGGSTLAQGYYFQGMVKPIVDDQGWYDSKDLGKWLDGELVIIGRADNLFISGGENIHCEEIETILNQHPKVQLAIVVPVKDGEYGARPVVVIRSNNQWLKPDGDIYLDGKLEKFKWPIAYFQMPDELLETGIKVSRKAVKDWLTAYQNQFTPL